MNKALIKKARELARKAHKDQVRKVSGVPYITHPIDVSKRVKKYLKGYVTEKELEEVCIVALLHDTLEDTKLKPAKIEKKFGPHILLGVQYLTYKKSWYPGFTRAEHQVKILDKLSKLPILPSFIKLADIASNADGLGDNPKDIVWRLRFLREKLAFLKALKIEEVPEDKLLKRYEYIHATIENELLKKYINELSKMPNSAVKPV